MAEKIIIDTDPGIDDAMAIFYAIESGQFDILGLTTIFGNVETDLATRNALSLLEIAGRTDIPVAQGAQKPLIQQYLGPVPDIHGADGMGNINLPAPTTEALGIHAAQFIIEQILSHPGEITLVPIGPLTNIALALGLEPTIAEKVKRVVLMGGAALVPGNFNPAAEANVYNDPEAAKVVFSAQWDITMIGLDITHKVLMNAEQLAQYGTSSKVTSQHIHRILPIYADFALKALGAPVLYMHDPTAISYLLNPSLFEVKDYPLQVATEGISRGKTWVWSQTVDFPPEAFGYDSNHPVHVVVDGDIDAINQMVVDTI